MPERFRAKTGSSPQIVMIGLRQITHTAYTGQRKVCRHMSNLKNNLNRVQTNSRLFLDRYKTEKSAGRSQKDSSHSRKIGRVKLGLWRGSDMIWTDNSEKQES